MPIHFLLHVPYLLPLLFIFISGRSDLSNCFRRHIRRKGDPSSAKFQEQWLESCDEAEKEVIYQSAYKAYVTINRTIPLILIVVMVANLILTPE